MGKRGGGPRLQQPPAPLPVRWAPTKVRLLGRGLLCQPGAPPTAGRGGGSGRSCCWWCSGASLTSGGTFLSRGQGCRGHPGWAGRRDREAVGDHVPCFLARTRSGATGWSLTPKHPAEACAFGEP